MKKISKKVKMNSGMTFIELITVLAIYAVLSLAIMFSYPKFQAKVDVTNYANDIAQEVVQAQSAALNGAWPPTGYNPTSPATWKPSYGVYFNASTTPDSNGADYKHFIYYVDLDSNKILSNGLEILPNGIYTITKGVSISDISTCTISDVCTALSGSNVNVYFTRPNSQAFFYSSSGALITGSYSYIQITILSPVGPTAHIRLYPSGRVQIS